MTPELRNELLNTRLDGIDNALIRIGLGRDAKGEAVNIRAHLIDLLALLDRNPGLDAASDDLMRSVQAFVEAGARGDPEDRQTRLLGEAYARFRNRLEAAGIEFVPADGSGSGVRLRNAEGAS